MRENRKDRRDLWTSAFLGICPRSQSCPAASRQPSSFQKRTSGKGLLHDLLLQPAALNVTGCQIIRMGLLAKSTPSVDYTFDVKEPVGWLRMQLQDDGIMLELQTLDTTHPRHRTRADLRWS